MANYFFTATLTLNPPAGGVGAKALKHQNPPKRNYILQKN
jgi:hypothetical protein